MQLVSCTLPSPDPVSIISCLNQWSHSHIPTRRSHLIMMKSLKRVKIQVDIWVYFKSSIYKIKE